MFDYIYDWLWNFVCYMVLITALLQALPENSYHKYLRFFCGVILILLLVSPIFRLLGMEQTFDQIYKNAEYRRIQREMESANAFLKELENEFWKEGI